MPTAEQLLDLDDGIGVVHQSCRFDLLDTSLTKIGTLEVREDSTPVVECNVHRRIKRTLTMAPSPGDIANVNVLRDRVRPVMTVGGTDYNLGVFLFADRSDVRYSWGTEPETVLVDQGLIVDQETETSIGVASGENLVTKIESLLSGVGISSSSISTTGTAGGSMAWPPGTSRMTVINQLASQMGGYSLFFDNDGLATVIEAPDADTPTLTYATHSPRVIAGSIVETNDALEAPNRFITIGQTGTADNETPVVGSYDVPDSAPHSAASRGFVVARVRAVQGIADAAAAAAHAQAWGKSQAHHYAWMQFQSPLDPRHDTFDVVSVDTGQGAVNWREQSWSMNLTAGGLMTHDLRRSYD